MTSDNNDVVIPDKYIRKIEEEKREILNEKPLSGRKLPAGTEVLYNPQKPEAFKENTMKNRRDFQNRDYTWTKEIRQKIWFDAPSDNVKKEFDEIEAMKEKLSKAVEINLQDSPGEPLPVPDLPWWTYFIPWPIQPKIKKFVDSSVITEKILSNLKDNSRVPEEIDWPQIWEDCLHKINEIKVFTIEGKGKKVDIVSAFITPLEIFKDKEAEIGSINQELENEVIKTYENWEKEEKQSKVSYTYFVFATTTEESNTLQPYASDDRWINIVEFNSPQEWQVKKPDFYGHRNAVVDFVERLQPETFSERYNKVKDTVETATLGNQSISLERVVEKTGYREKVIKDLFASFEKSEGYKLYKNKGKLRIRKAKEGGTTKRFSPSSLLPMQFSFGRNILRIIAVLIWLSGFFLEELFHQFGGFNRRNIIIIVVAGYAVKCLQDVVNEYKERYRQS